MKTLLVIEETNIVFSHSYKIDAIEPSYGGRLLPNGTFTGFVGKVQSSVSRENVVNLTITFQ